MTKSLLISVKPKWLYLILNGSKTIEVRKVVPKWVLEAIDRGESVNVYWYCTKGGKPLLKFPNGHILGYWKNVNGRNIKLGDKLNGRIVAKSVLRKIDRYVDYSGCTNNENGYECLNKYMYHLCELTNELKKTCLTCDELEAYGNDKDLYALHISNVEIFDEPKLLGEFYTGRMEYHQGQEDYAFYDELKRPPQNMQTVWVK